MSLTKKGVLVLLCSALFAAATGIYVVATSRQIMRLQNQATVAHEIVTCVFELDSLTYESLLRRSERIESQWRGRSAALKDLLKQAREGGMPEEALAAIDQDQERFDAFYETLARSHETPGDSARKSALRELLIGQLSRLARDMVSEATRMFDSIEGQRRALRAQLITVILAGLTLLVGLTGVTMYIFKRGVAEPILKLRQGAENISSGRLDYRVPVASQDEIGQLASAFNQMTQSLEESYGRLGSEIDERRRAQEELKLAHESLEKRVAERTAELQAAKLDAETANRIKDEFLAIVSHELRTPLTPILGWARMLRAGSLDAEKTARALDVIERNVGIQTQVINDLLDVSRIVTGKMRLNLGPVDVDQVIRAAVASAQGSAEAKGVTLTTELQAVRIAGDASRLQQVFSNLLVNAIKFTPRDGRVAVSMHQYGAQLQVKVSDNGVGIAPDFLPQIFQRFKQEDSSASRKHGGLGLGLAIARHLIELHGGTISAASAGPEKGAVFTVTLPIPAIMPSDISFDGAPPGAQKCPLLGISVLVVDDEPDARELLQEVIRQAGGTVSVAASAHDALQSLQQFRPGIVVSDIGMPGEDGYSLIRRIRNLTPEQGGLTAALALSAFAREEDRARALEAGFQNHLAKPIEPGELIAEIARLVAAG